MYNSCDKSINIDAVAHFKLGLVSQRWVIIAKIFLHWERSPHIPFKIFRSMKTNSTRNLDRFLSLSRQIDWQNTQTWINLCRNYCCILGHVLRWLRKIKILTNIITMRPDIFISFWDIASWHKVSESSSSSGKSEYWEPSINQRFQS